MSNQWITLFDVDKCTGCCNCVLATLDEHVGNDHRGYSSATPLHGTKLLDIDFSEHGSYPVVDVAYTLRACQHCDKPACAQAAPEAVTKRGDGIVIIDPIKARGRRDLVAACPFGAISWNEETQVPQIWTMDAHLLDKGWTDSRGSQACPTGALETQRMSPADVREIMETGAVEPFDRSISANPNVLYRNLARVRTAFIAGTVIEANEAIHDVVAGATVVLNDINGKPLAESTTDQFGDFRLPCNGAEGSLFRIVVTDARNRSVSIDYVAGAKCYVGTIELG